MLNSDNRQKLFTLFGLYIAQSIPMSFFSTVVPVIMRQENYSLESIGLLQLIKLPWIFKFLWAPLVDRSAGTPGRYKSWIVSSELFYAIVILSIGFLDPADNFRFIIVMMIIAFVASATQDIATDALAILVLKKEERGIGNSMQSAGSFTGTLVGRGLLLVLYQALGWSYLLYALAIFVVIAMVPLLFYKPVQSSAPSDSAAEAASMKDIVSFFRMPGIPGRVIMLVLFYSGIIGSLAMFKPLLVDHGYNMKQIGLITGIAGTSLAAVSALAAGRIMRKQERWQSMRLFSLLILLATGYLLFTSIVDKPLLLISGILFVWVSYGFSTVGIYTTSMDVVRKGREGTDFTLQIVITHLSSLVIAVMSGRFADMVGYRGLFTAGAVLALISFIYVLKLYPAGNRP